jgi:hypothetical protein
MIQIPEFLSEDCSYPPDSTYKFTGEFIDAPRYSSRRVAARNNPTVYYPLYKNSKGHTLMSSQFLSKEEYQSITLNK